MTASELDAADESIAESGVDDFVVKSIRFDELKTRILRWLD